MSARARKAALGALVCLALLAPAQAGAAGFSVGNFAISPEAGDGSPAAQAGSHPFAVSTSFDVGFDEATLTPGGWLRDFLARIPSGLVGDTTAYPRCTTAEFLQEVEIPAYTPACPVATQVGAAGIGVKPNPESTKVAWEPVPVFNLTPPPGVLLRLGFRFLTQNVFIDITLDQAPPYEPLAASRDTVQVVDVLGAKIQLWGNPSDPAHDEQRTPCGPLGNSPPAGGAAGFRFVATGKSCSVQANSKPFLTLPTQCAEPLASSFEALSWEGERSSGSALSPALSGCGLLSFKPSSAAQPTSRAASSPSGLDFSLGLEDEGLTSVSGRAQSEIEKTVVTLPKGMTLNPSQAEGLEVCTEADLERETLTSQPGEGCPEASRIGTIEVESPLVEEPLPGALYVAEPYHNLAGDSLIAVYVVIRSPHLGIIVKQPLKVEPDPSTGQLISSAEDMPQLPFSHFRLHFREGGRAPLISPPGCGRFDTLAKLYPRSGAPPVTSTSSFQIISGPGEGPCPSAAAPFHPGFEAGTLNNQAGSYSPFVMRLTRKDGEQDMGRFSFVLPPGVVPKLAGIPYCPEAGIARAIGRSGAHGGAEELDDPSCPAASQIGRTLAGAGVGGQLTYVPGKLYLAGPYHGDPISAVAITPAVAGPFDAGVVVVREALRLNPVTHVGEVDGAASDPIPHILKGIPLNVRDLRVYADRPEFTLNATSCEPFQALSTIWGDGTALEPRGDTPAGLASRYQAAGCASLGFKPKLGLKLRGATRRGGFPALRATYTPRPGDANLANLALQFPHSEFIEQGHFRTICTRAQFAAGEGFGSACPAGSVYGHVRAFSPLLAEPLEGPVYLRSSDHNLPDAILALHGLVDIAVDVRIDSRNGRLRASLADSPDAPVSRAIVDMQGAQKGLFVNSTNLCGATHRAIVDLGGQNGKLERITPAVRAARCARAHR